MWGLRAELNQARCLFSAIQGQEMFTAVYLCYSPASQLWLAPFTRPQLQLQLNKTSNRDARPFCLSSHPSPINDRSSSHGRKEGKRCFLLPVLLLVHSQFSLFLHLFIFPVQHCGGSVRLTSIYPSHQDLIPLQGSLSSSLALTLPLSPFLQENCAFYVMEACCSL